MKNSTDIPLENLSVLIFDCQATGANPDTNHILDAGWAVVKGSQEIGDDAVISYVVAPPPDYAIPKAVLRVTGMHMEMFENALPLQDIRRHLAESADAVTRANGNDSCPIVIHYASFEMPYLTMLFNLPDAGNRRRFHTLCTHKIAAKLFPGLPRKGLRAVAGYLGISMQQHRRSGDHVLATAGIWRSMIAILRDEHSITTLGGLIDWFAEPSPRTVKERRYPIDTSILKTIPDSPGVYTMRRSNGEVVYIGKATSLKQRVRSYFRTGSRHSEHILEMLSQVKGIEYRTTSSELEAALLESDSIKRMLPPYNIALKTGEQAVHFRSRDLRECSLQRTDHHCIGPLIANRLFSSFIGIMEAIKGGSPDGIDTGLPAAIFAHFSSSALPDIHCFNSGMKLFTEKYPFLQDASVPLQAFLALGTRLWLMKIAADEESSECADGVKDQVDGEVISPDDRALPMWSPESILGFLESILADTAHHVRRARWFCLLAESSVAWRTRGGDSGQKHILILNDGAVHSSTIVPLDETVPPSPGYRKRFGMRQQCFDRECYDRMRILTTELRKIVREGRFLELLPSPRVSIDVYRMSRFLPLV